MEEKAMHDFLLEHLDWCSVTNNEVPYDDLLIDLSKNGIKFVEKRNYENKYIVIEKPYDKFIDYAVGNSSYRITRFDLAFDIEKDFMEVVKPHIDEWSPHSCVGSKDRYQTLYFNSRQSDMFCRLYDKQLEAHLDKPLTRLEYEIKGIIARQFSWRLCYIGIDDAMTYIIDYIIKFNTHKNLYLINFEHISDIIPVDYPFIEQRVLEDKFRRFIRQYRDSIKNYCEEFYISGNELLQICSDDLDIERVIEGRRHYAREVEIFNKSQQRR